MDRIFLDANVLFSAAWRPESPLRALWSRDVERVTSSYAVEEARRNLAALRPESLPDLEHLLTGLRIQPVTDDMGLDPGIPLAEKDRPILAAAIAILATHLLTGDKTHFGPFYGTTVHGVRILPPSVYLADTSDHASSG